MKRTPAFQFVTDKGDARGQMAALCWRRHKRRIEVLLVTSRETRRWVIPKGWPMEGLSGGDAARIEAWEEAGVRGAVSDAAIGVYTYEKVLDRNGGGETVMPCVVSVHALAVTGQSPRYPEAGQRRLRWFSQQKAARKVDEPELRALIAGFRPDAPSGKAGG